MSVPHKTSLSPRQLECLTAYARHGDRRQAAASIGISFKTMNIHLEKAYAFLGVQTSIDAFRAVGWLKVP